MIARLARWRGPLLVPLALSGCRCPREGPREEAAAAGESVPAAAATGPAAGAPGVAARPATDGASCPPAPPPRIAPEEQARLDRIGRERAAREKAQRESEEAARRRRARCEAAVDRLLGAAAGGSDPLDARLLASWGLEERACVALLRGATSACGDRRFCAARAEYFLAARGTRPPRLPALMIETCPDFARDGASCAALRTAVEASDAARCPGADREPRLHAWCRALASLDAPACKRIPAEDERARCGEEVARQRLLRDGGLRRIAQAGAPADRMLASAALGDSRPCREALRARAVEHCADDLRRADMSVISESVRPTDQ